MLYLLSKMIVIFLTAHSSFLPPRTDSLATLTDSWPRASTIRSATEMPLTAGRQTTVILDAVGTAARVITNTGYSIVRDEIPAYSPKSKSGYEYSSSGGIHSRWNSCLFFRRVGGFPLAQPIYSPRKGRRDERSGRDTLSTASRLAPLVLTLWWLLIQGLFFSPLYFNNCNMKDEISSHEESTREEDRKDLI